ncbi:hypothetical protein GUJ93_ZPchr0481g2892 [Zizania palustris]|uniref:Uncharacterized protein n=1 Tax=Zizania palustris TaxID=103762 RepID=A0A8J5V081_ZIZPA|nr:hypothetical protein GUJ93_ZPchr0481g2892 [Zizania palustris]
MVSTPRRWWMRRQKHKGEDGIGPSGLVDGGAVGGNTGIIPSMPQVRMPTMPDKLQVLAIVQVKASAQRMQQPLEDVEKITVETKEVPICVMRPLSS